MAKVPDPRREFKYCPTCKGELRYVPQDEMNAGGFVSGGGAASEDTHTYECLDCTTRFEIIKSR